jgi:LysM repeat protein
MPFLKNIFTFFGLLLSITYTTAQSKSKPTEAKDSVKINYVSFTPESLSDSIVNFGKIFLNTPYRYGSPGVDSFDCSGFTSFVYRNFGYNLQRSSCDQAQQFDTVDRNQIKTGDLVFFSGRGISNHVGHVGIVVKPKENGQFEFIHAAVHTGVTISNSEDPYYSRRFIKANRVVGSNPLLDYAYMPKSDHFNAPMPFAGKVQQTRKTVPAEFHKVKRGETLSSIADKFDLTIAQLKEMNGIKKNSISRNQRLKVKEEEKLMIVESAPKELANNESPEDDESSAALSNTSTHTVKRGETLFSISKTYNVTVGQLQAFNHLKNNSVQSGQQLIIAQIATNVSANSKTDQTPKTISYKVKKGESLFTISKDFNISVEDLKVSNKLSGNGVQVGQKLKIIQIPVVVTTVAKAADSTPKTISYKVKKGESLFTIAKDNNISVDDLKAANKLTSNNVKVGQELKITQATAVANTTIAKTDLAPKTISYKVKKGESLFTIAKDNNTTVDDLKAANKLTSNSVQAGQELKITQTTAAAVNSTSTKTDLAPKSITYKVKKGESLFTIAKDNNTTVDDLKAANKLTSNSVQAGQELKITQATAAANTTSAKTDIAPKTISYKVKKGESLFTIAKDNNITVDDIKATNKLTSNNVQAGQEILIVQAAITKKIIDYKVKKGDNLSSIANSHNISVDELKDLNQLTSKKVSAGQSLKVYAEQVEETKSSGTKSQKKHKKTTHKVRKGESYFSIAQANDCSIDDLRAWNKKSKDHLKAGDKLVLFPKEI